MITIRVKLQYASHPLDRLVLVLGQDCQTEALPFDAR